MEFIMINIQFINLSDKLDNYPIIWKQIKLIEFDWKSLLFFNELAVETHTDTFEHQVAYLTNHFKSDSIRLFRLSKMNQFPIYSNTPVYINTIANGSNYSEITAQLTYSLSSQSNM